MQISWPKTKLMAVTPNPTNHLPLKICNMEVQFVDSVTYLGSLITNDGSSSRDITSCIAKAVSVMCRLLNPLFRKHRISIRTKINMYRALVVSVLLYGYEAWSTTLADRRCWDVSTCAAKGASCVSSVSSTSATEASVNKPNNQPHHISYGNAAYAGSDISTACHPPIGAKGLHGFNPNIHGWKTPRGRPKTRWADSIKHDLNSAGLDSTSAAQMVFDRPQWKTFISGLPTIEPEQGS